MFKYSSTKIKIPNIQVVINVLFGVLQYLSNFPANPNVPLDFLSNAIKLPNKPHTINTHWLSGLPAAVKKASDHLLPNPNPYIII